MSFLDKTGTEYLWGKIKALVNKNHDELTELIGDIDWFGAGTSIPADSDLDTYKTVGKYFVSSTSISNTIVNAPFKGTNYTLFVFVRTSGKSLTQMAISLNNKIAIRSASSTGVYGDWVVNEADTALKLKTPRTISLTGDVSGSVEFDGSANVTMDTKIAFIEPNENDIPKVFLTGSEFSNMTAEKNEVNMEMEYRSKTKQFSAFILIKYQGRSSLSKPKKNFTIKMYSDEARKTKKKLAFKDWEYKTHKYVLKANFIDHTHSRNIIGANLWSEVVASRSDYDTLPEELRNSPRNGAIDGFPIKLYVNGTYQGIYTWNIGKDDWMWGMDEDNTNHVLLSNEGDQGSSVVNSGNFRKVWNGTDGSHWSIEVGTNSTALKTSLNNLITFVMNNNGSAFRNGIGTYLDIQSAIDYYIHQYVICNIDSLALNMLLATYDGTKWMLGAYDMDSTFGLWWTGEKFLSAEYRCPEDYQDKFSLLFERLEENYWNEIQSRYAELRKTVYSSSNMFTHFERFTDRIGNDLYEEDLEAYPTIPQGSTCNIKQLRNFIRDRLVYCDGQITNGIPATAVTLSATELTIKMGDNTTLTATKTPSNATDDVCWYSSDTTIATVSNGVVKAVAEGSCTIYAKCGSGYASCDLTVASASEPDEPEASYTNLVPTSIDTNGSIYNGTGYKDGYRLSSSGGVSGTAVEKATHTGFIKFKKGDIIRVLDKGGWDYIDGVSGNYFNFYNISDFSLVTADYPSSYNNGTYGTTETLADGSTLITMFTNTNSSLTANTEYYLRISFNPGNGANLIVTVNEEIV